MKELLNVPVAGISSIVSIEIIDKILTFQPAFAFIGQSIIGILTIIYLAKKIKNMKK